MEKKLYKNDLLSVLIQPCIFDKSMALLSFDDSPGSFLNISLHCFGCSVSKLLTKKSRGAKQLQRSVYTLDEMS